MGLAQKRYVELDSVRGLAALSVVLLHLASIYVGTTIASFEVPEKIIRTVFLTPFGVLLGGSQAVLVFFVLSGFVLTLMIESQSLSYGQYVVRRVMRLYVPYVASIVAAVLLIGAFGSRKIPAQSDWLNQFLGVTLTARMVTDHLLFIGAFETDKLNFVIWSLVHEMRISLAFPLIVWALKRSGWKISVSVSFVVAVLALALYYYIDRRTAFPLLKTIPETFYWVIFFVIGASIALNRDRVAAWYAQQSATNLGVLWIGTAFFYILPARFTETTGIRIGMLYALLTLPAVTFVIVVALCSPTVKRWLLWYPLVQLGRVSYSLYLCHAVILLACVNLLFGRISTLFLLLVALLLTLLTSVLAYSAIERPSNRFGAVIAERISARRNAPGTVRA